MHKLRILKRSWPDRGRYIPDQTAEYCRTSDGLPAMKFTWQGTFLRSGQELFVFARDATTITELTDDEARTCARLSGFSRGGSLVLGLIPKMVGGAVGAATAKTSG